MHPTLISRSCRLGRFPFTPGNLGLHSSIWQSSPGLPDRDCCEGNQSALVYRKPAAAGSEVCLGRQPQATGHNPRHKRAGLLILGSGLLKLHSGSAIPSLRGFLLDSHHGSVPRHPDWSPASVFYSPGLLGLNRRPPLKLAPVRKALSYRE